MAGPEWSAAALERQAERSVLVINPVVSAEVSIRFERIEDLDDVLPATVFRRDPLPWETAFLAGKCFFAEPEVVAPTSGPPGPSRQ